MNIQEGLKVAGLTGNEVKIYCELLKKGELAANIIAKNIGMDRTQAYTVLTNLIDKGQVSYIIKKKRKYFSLTNPENLLNSIKKREAVVNDLIPELKKVTTSPEDEPEVKILEGRDGLRTVMNIMLKCKDFCAFGSTGWAYHQLYETPWVVKETSKRNIRVRIIASRELKHTEKSFMKTIQYRFIDVISKSPTSIFGDYVSIHLTTREKPFLLLIKSKDIAETYRNHFEILWSIAEE